MFFAILCRCRGRRSFQIAALRLISASALSDGLISLRCPRRDWRRRTRRILTLFQRIQGKTVSDSGTVTEAQIIDALRRVQDPDRRQDVVALNMVSGLAVKDGHVQFALEVDPKRGPHLEPLRKAAETAVETLPGVLSATAALTAQKPTPAARPAAGRGAPLAPGAGPAGGPNSPGGKQLVPGVRTIIAVASGKGGVGKSTTATNLAVALAAKGLKVGILDADIYGPSQPRMMGITGRPHSPDGKTLAPMQNYGVKVMSMGFLVPEDTPMIWRGPMVMGALEKMLRDVA